MVRSTSQLWPTKARWSGRGMWLRVTSLLVTDHKARWSSLIFWTAVELGIVQDRGVVTQNTNWWGLFNLLRSHTYRRHTEWPESNPSFFDERGESSHRRWQDPSLFVSLDNPELRYWRVVSVCSELWTSNIKVLLTFRITFETSIGTTHRSVVSHTAERESRSNRHLRKSSRSLP